MDKLEFIKIYLTNKSADLWKKAALNDTFSFQYSSQASEIDRTLTIINTSEKLYEDILNDMLDFRKTLELNK